MEQYIKITQLNDFVFCPRSVYFHELYGNIAKEYYHTDMQRNGTAAHASIKYKNYSTRKNILQGVDVYSEKYGLQGKIDLFDIEKGLLTERKKKIKVIYDGYVFQLYAQYFALKEMGYKIQTIRFYSMDDNKVYPIPKPEENTVMLEKFEKIIEDIYSFDLNTPFTPNTNKCAHCIYSELCDYATEDKKC